MEWLNYHHLLYFWMVAKEGSITRAADILHLAQPTLSSQIKKLEKSIGANLFIREGRNLSLSETGQTVFRYADEIFTLGMELNDTLQGNTKTQSLKLTVGVPDILPKLVVYELLKPALELEENVQFECYEGKTEDLINELVRHRVDIVLSDSPLPPHSHIRAFNHLLGECGVSVFGDPELTQKYRKDFPQSLHGAPMLLPTRNTVLRRMQEQWFDQSGIHPEVRHEFEDSAVLKVFGQAGEGLFFAPSAIEEPIMQQYSVHLVGRIFDIKERFYAISVQRRLKHPAIVAISNAAKNELFGEH